MILKRKFVSYTLLYISNFRLLASFEFHFSNDIWVDITRIFKERYFVFQIISALSSCAQYNTSFLFLDFSVDFSMNKV